MSTHRMSNLVHENLFDVSVEEYPDAILDRACKPPYLRVSNIIFGNDDGLPIMIVHFEPLTDEQFADHAYWRYDYDTSSDIYSSRINDIAEAAKQRWPEVRIFKVPGCLCCNGVDDLREYDCEL